MSSNAKHIKVDFMGKGDEIEGYLLQVRRMDCIQDRNRKRHWVKP